MQPISVLKYLKNVLEARRSALEAVLEDLKGIEAINKRVHNPALLSFKVELTSLWAGEGEKNVSVTVKGSLKKAVEQAVAEFKRVNSRSDVQAAYRVVVIARGPKGLEIDLPREYWEKYKL